MNLDVQVTNKVKKKRKEKREKRSAKQGEFHTYVHRNDRQKVKVGLDIHNMFACHSKSRHTNVVWEVHKMTKDTTNSGTAPA